MNGEAVNDVLMLPAALDLGAAESFLELIRSRTHGDAMLRMDASQVETLTLPCIQIVLAAARSAGALKIRNPSNAFVGAFEDLGVEWMAYLDSGPDDDVASAESLAAGENEIHSDSGEIDPHQTNERAMSKRILTIDDSKTMRDMLMLTLAEAGFDVLQAVDGQDGLDVLTREQVDVVITDINMPRMDGYEVIRQLRRDPTHKTTPILVLTTESEAEKKNLAREAGATGWMVKPFDPDRLVATVLKVAP